MLVRGSAPKIDKGGTASALMGGSLSEMVDMGRYGELFVNGTSQSTRAVTVDHSHALARFKCLIIEKLVEPVQGRSYAFPNELKLNCGSQILVV